MADELRDLAHNINDQTRQIRERAASVTRTISDTETAVATGTATAERGETTIEMVGDGFKQIMALVTKMGRDIKTIHVSVRQQEGACAELSSSISGIANVASEVARNAERAERTMTNLHRLAGELKVILADYE